MRHRGVMVLCAGAALLLGACSGAEPVAQDPPLATPTAITPTAAPWLSPTIPSLPARSLTPATPTGAAAGLVPAAARAHDDAGAEAYMRHYLAQVNVAWITADPGALDGLAADGCDTCSKLLARAANLEKDGLHYDGVPLTAGPSVLLPESNAVTTYFQIASVEEARAIRRKDGSVAKKLSRRAGASEIGLEWTADSWQVAQIKTVKPE